MPSQKPQTQHSADHVIVSAAMTPKFLFFVIPFVVGYALDQLTKNAIVARFEYAETLVVIDGFFDLTHVRNPGGAFSFFANADPVWRLPFFLGAPLIAIVLLFVFYRRTPPDARFSALALGLVLGGALGNLTDRLRYGEVIDFLEVHLWSGYTWPTFNVADSLVVVGVIMLLIETFFEIAPEAESPGSERAGDVSS